MSEFSGSRVPTAPGSGWSRLKENLTSAEDGSRQRKRTGGARSLSATWVAFLVISAASPVTSLLGAVAIGFSTGNGVGLPAAFAVVALILACFAVGYAAISRRVINTGAYYAYIAQGVGRPVAIGAGLLAVVAYTVNVAGIAGSAGYFLHVIAGDMGANVHWLFGTVPMLVLVWLVGSRSLHVSAKVMGTILIFGTAVLLVYDIGILAKRGFAAFPLASFQPHMVFSGSIGLALAVALTCYVGVDTAALYAEETAEPERTVPRATYVSIAVMAAFYVLSIWLVIGSIGVDQVVPAAVANPGELIFNDILAVGGEGLQAAAALAFLSASFAGILAFHNAASRYLYVLGRDRVVSRWVGQLHPQRRSPFRASIVVIAGASLVIAIAAVFQLDPYVVLAKGALGIATLGIVTLQAFAAVAIVVFFRRRGHGRYWKTLILPGAGAVGLFAVASGLLVSFDDLMGLDNPLVFALPWLIVAILLGGVITGLVLRQRAPGRYARIAQSRLRPQARTLPRPAHWTRRYCLIGAGPAGLVMARRLVEEGVPFDWYDAGTGVGGMWNPERPGSPVYESLTMATSKYVSALPDFPMPAHFPDYPHWWQTRDYLRSYADYFGLTQRVQFGTTVTWANPEGQGWSVTLSTGAFRYYSGIIAAPGTSWWPSLPTWPGQERFRGQLLHSVLYKTPASLAGRRVLVIGAGASAVDIACDAARAGAVTFLSIRHGRRIRPRYLHGVPTDAVLGGRLEPVAAAPGSPHELISVAIGDVTALGLPRPDASAQAGHPVMTDDLLTLLAGGRIQVRREVAEIEADGVRFVDGSSAQVDLIIAATGFDRRIPFVDAKTYARNGRPDLYLNIFSRSHEGLAVLGLSDLGGPAFPSYDDQARAVMVDITVRELGGVEQRAWRSGLFSEPNLRGGTRFADSPERAFTVDDNAYSTRLRDLCDRFGYPPGGSWGDGPSSATEPAAPPGLGAALRASSR